jgi:bile acid:Na+ symporter, BASS family
LDALDVSEQSMEALQTLIPTLITFSLAGLVLAVGLHAGRGDLLTVIRDPRQLWPAILAVIIIPPIAAGLLVAMLPLEPVVKAGIMLMAISPVPPLVPGKEIGIGGRRSYAYGLYVAMSLLTVISVPVVLAMASALFGRDDSISFMVIAETLVLGVLLPLAVGFLIRHFAPGFAERWWRRIYAISTVLVALAFLPVMIKSWPAITALIGNGTLLAMAVVTLIAIAAGHLLGGPDLRDRATLAIAASVRHPGIAMTIASLSFQDRRVSAAVLLFMLVGMAVSIPYTMWIKRHLSPPSHPAHA